MSLRAYTSGLHDITVNEAYFAQCCVVFYCQIRHGIVASYIKDVKIRHLLFTAYCGAIAACGVFVRKSNSKHKIEISNEIKSTFTVDR